MAAQGDEAGPGQWGRGHSSMNAVDATDLRTFKRVDATGCDSPHTDTVSANRGGQSPAQRRPPRTACVGDTAVTV